MVCSIPFKFFNSVSCLVEVIYSVYYLDRLFESVFPTLLRSLRPLKPYLVEVFKAVKALPC